MRLLQMGLMLPIILESKSVFREVVSVEAC